MANWLDSLITYFSPRAGYRRLQYQKAAEVMRAYDAAASGRRTKNWKAPSTSANAEVGSGLVMLRNRARDMVRNDPYARRAVNLIPNNVVGKGILPYFTGGRAEAYRQIWKDWAERPRACDWDGQKDIYCIQRQAVKAIAESGEVLIRRRRVGLGDMDTLPIQLQVLEADFLVINSSLVKAEAGNTVIQGVEFNPEGKRVAYHLYKNHPGNASLTDFSGLRQTFETVRVPADDILHIYDIERAGQVRGITWLAPVLLRIRDFNDYEQAQLVRQKIAQCFTAFIHDLEAPDSLTTQDKSDLGQQVEPGIIEILPPGKDVKFGTPPGPGVEFKDYASVILHAVAAGIGVSYEALTGDLAEVNFSSARMGWLEFNRNVDAWRAHMVKPMLNDPIARWFFDAAILVGVPGDDTAVSWTAPRREMIDPTKEVPAKIKSVRAGIETLSDVVRQTGKHPEDHYQEIKNDNELIDANELVLDSDPRKVTTNGQLQDSGDEEV